MFGDKRHVEEGGTESVDKSGPAGVWKGVWSLAMHGCGGRAFWGGNSRAGLSGRKQRGWGLSGEVGAGPCRSPGYPRNQGAEQEPWTASNPPHGKRVRRAQA
jgi:hypothetical protein